MMCAVPAGGNANRGVATGEGIVSYYVVVSVLDGGGTKRLCRSAKPSGASQVGLVLPITLSYFGRILALTQSEG